MDTSQEDGPSTGPWRDVGERIDTSARMGRPPESGPAVIHPSETFAQGGWRRRGCRKQLVCFRKTRRRSGQACYGLMSDAPTNAMPSGSRHQLKVAMDARPEIVCCHFAGHRPCPPDHTSWALCSELRETIGKTPQPGRGTCPSSHGLRGGRRGRRRSLESGPMSMNFDLAKVLTTVGPAASIIFAAWIFVAFLQTRYDAAVDRYEN